MEASKELAVPGSATMDLVWDAILNGTPLDLVMDSAEAQRAIAGRIRELESEEEILDPASLPAWRDWLDEPVGLVRTRLAPSSFEEGPSVYLIADITVLKTGEMLTVHCGGANVVAQAMRLWELGKLPVKVALVEASRHSPGKNPPLWLVSLDKDGRPRKRKGKAAA